MTDKQAVIDALERLPENVSFEEITEELRIMAAIRRGRADIAAGRTKTRQEAEHLRWYGTRKEDSPSHPID